MMKNKMHAAIDIGSNSVRLLICQKTKDGLARRMKYSEMTRIGKGVDQTGMLDEMRVDATISALKHYAEKLDEYAITHCPVFATSAVRDARNQQQFIARVKAETPFTVSVLSGDEEAYYGFLGVVKGYAQQAKNIVVIDVGGGSTELIFGSADGNINYAHSFDIGAVRMTDRFNLTHAMPISASLPIEKCLYEMFDNEKIASYVNADTACIAIGGTATNLAAIDLGLTNYDGSVVQKHQMSRARLKVLTKELMTATRAEKLKITGLQTGRVDIISAGAIIISSVLRYLGKEHLAFSDYDNLEGAIFLDDK